MAPDPVPRDTALNYGTGWKPDTYDHNDKLLGDLYGMKRLPLTEVYQTIVERAEKHKKFTLEASCPPVYNQLQLGSCTANATAAALRFAWKHSLLHYSTPYNEFDPSRLWIYYYARLMEDPREDKRFKDIGSGVRNSLKVLKKKGVCTEKAWPYLEQAESDAVEKFREKTKDQEAIPRGCRAGIPPSEANDDNVKKFFDFSFDYHRIRSLADGKDKAADADTVINQMCACLAEGFPIIFGFRLYKEADGRTEEFHDPKNWKGDVFNVQIDKLENRGADSGGHTVLCVGFDREKKLFRAMNSWGSGWGNGGYFWMPFSWFEHAGTIKVQVQGKPGTTTIQPAYDLWTIRPHLAPLLRDHDPVQ